MSYMPAWRSLAEWVDALSTRPKLTSESAVVRGHHFSRKYFPIQQPRLVVLVGGTNGKGSVVALLESIFTRCGYGVGTFTSPHLLDYEERIRIQAQNVPAASVLSAFADIYQCEQAEQVRLSPFEYLFFAAMQIFQQAQLDIWLIEVGIGGQSDVTNILVPDISIITSVHFDHAELLGYGLAAITWQKLGIARTNTPLIVGKLPQANMLEQMNAKVGAKLYFLGKDFTAKLLPNQCWQFSNSDGECCLPFPSSGLLLDNLAIALQCIALVKAQGIPVKQVELVQGLQQVTVLGRQQLVNHQGQYWLFDVAHNAAAIAALAIQVQTLPFMRVIAVFGCHQRKWSLHLLNAIYPLVSQWHVVPLCHLQETFRPLLAPQATCTYYETFVEATAAAWQEADDGKTLVLVFGSFTTVAEVYRLLLCK